MASRRNRYSRVRALEQELREGLRDLSAARKTLEQWNDALQRVPETVEDFTPPELDRIKRIRVKLAKIPNSDYRKMQSLLSRFGVYEPKTRKITPAKKATIRKRWEAFEDLQKSAAFAEYPPGTSAKTKARIKRDARKAYPAQFTTAREFPETELLGKAITSKKGVWLPRAQRQINEPVGRLVYDRDMDAWALVVRKPTKSGLTAVERRYIAQSDVLDKKQKQIERRFNRMRPLKRNERLRFIIGKNESRRTFRNMSELFRYAQRYRKDDRARATFLNELVIEYVAKGPAEYVWRGKGKKQHKAKNVWTKRVEGFRASNYHSVNPAELMDIEEELEE